MKTKPSKNTESEARNPNIVWHDHRVSKEERAKLKGQKPCILWFTGLSGSGKSTIANAVEELLCKAGKHTYLLDGDNIRSGLNSDLGFSESDRVENIRRIGELAKLFADAGLIVLSAFISPFAREREFVRSLVDNGEFVEIFVNTPLHICETRDPKGLYTKARSGEIHDFTGIDSPYEVPKRPEIVLHTEKMDVHESAQKVFVYLKEKGFLDA